MQLTLDPTSTDDYLTFLKVKRLPRYSVVGRSVEFPDEYAGTLGLKIAASKPAKYKPMRGLFDYQAAISRTAIEKRKFAVFMECGLGKTLVLLEFARHAAASLPKGKAVLIVSPLMVIGQTVSEAVKFYGDDLPIEHVKSSNLGKWLESGSRIGITNYEALTDELKPGRLGALILDESSMLKSHYGKWGTTAIRIGKGLEYKLALTGTPAPNDRIEYANHAAFLDQFPTVNSFLARFFINRGETQERWELKPHALKPFYKALGHWSIFLTNPATYGWKDNATTIPPINVHIHEVPLTTAQRELFQSKTGQMFAGEIGGIASRSMMGQIAKGSYRGTDIESNKPKFIRDLIETWPDESTLVWCIYNREQEQMQSVLPMGESVTGDTDEDVRIEAIRRFRDGASRILISKPKILGFGLNLQIATRQVFSGLQDSYEQFHQAVKRSNRVGSTRPLNVHIPVTELERPMIETVLHKAKRIDEETREQEEIFKSATHS